MWCFTVHNRYSVESCAAPTVATIGCLKSQSTKRPRKSPQKKNQCSHLHRNINCLERRRVIFVNERLFLTACIVILCFTVFFFLVIWGDRITALWLNKTTDWKALKDIYYIKWVCLTTCEWVPRSETFPRALRQWSGPIVLALTLKLLIWGRYLAAVVWARSQDHQ